MDTEAHVQIYDDERRAPERSLDMARRKEKVKNLLRDLERGEILEEEKFRRTCLQTINEMLEAVLQGPIEPGAKIKDILDETSRDIAESIAKVEGKDPGDVLKQIQEFRTDKNFERSLVETIHKSFEARFDRIVSAKCGMAGEPKTLNGINDKLREIAESAVREGVDEQWAEQSCEVIRAKWTAELFAENQIWETLGRELEQSDVQLLKDVLEMKDVVEFVRRGSELLPLMRHMSSTAQEAWQRLYLTALSEKPAILVDLRAAVQMQIDSREEELKSENLEWTRRPKEERRAADEQGRPILENVKLVRQRNKILAAIQKEITALKQELSPVEEMYGKLSRSVSDHNFRELFIKTVSGYGGDGNKMWLQFGEGFLLQDTKKRQEEEARRIIRGEPREKIQARLDDRRKTVAFLKAELESARKEHAKSGWGPTADYNQVFYTSARVSATEKMLRDAEEELKALQNQYAKL